MNATHDRRTDREQGHESQHEPPVHEAEAEAEPEAAAGAHDGVADHYRAREAAWRDEAAPLAERLQIAPVIRADGEARERTEARGARGLAIGNTIYLHPDAIAPGTAEGRRVLVHELVHIAQAQGKHTLGARADAEREAATMAADGGANLAAPVHGIDLTEAAADRDGEPAPVAERTAEDGKPPLRGLDKPELGPDEPYRWIPGAYAFWLRRSWFTKNYHVGDDDRWYSTERITELLNVLRAKGIMAWATAEDVAYAAPRLSIGGSTEEIFRISLGVSAFAPLGLPPGTTALVGRKGEGLEIVLRVANPGVARDQTFTMTEADKRHILEALTSYTRLQPQEAGVTILMSDDLQPVYENGAVQLNVPENFCNELFGEKAWKAWRDQPVEDSVPNFGPGQAQSLGDLTPEEIDKIQQWLKANLPAGDGEGGGAVLSRALLELIEKIEGHPEKERILAMLRGDGDGKAKAGGLNATILERVIHEAEFEAAREAEGFDKLKPADSDTREPMFDFPLPARLHQVNGKVIANESVKFTLDIDWPATFFTGDEAMEYRWRKWQADIDWKFERVDGDGTTLTELAHNQTGGGTQGIEHKLTLPEGVDEGVWTVHAFVRHSHFQSNHLTTQVTVKTEEARLAELRGEAFAGMGGYETTDPDFNFDTSTYNEWFGDREYDHGKQFRGDLPPGFTQRTPEERAKTIDAEIRRTEDLLAYFRKQVGDHGDAIAASEHYLAKMRDAKKALEKDATEGWVPFEIRGTFLGRGNHVADGALDLYGAVQRTQFGDATIVSVQIRDLSRRLAADNYRFTGSGKTFEGAFEEAFVDLCKEYPAGKVSVLAEGFDASGSERTGKSVGFELDTGTEWEDTKSVVFDPVVQAVVNIGSALVMIFAPFTIPVLLPLTIAYNEVQNIDEMVHAWDNGTLTPGKTALSLAQIGLDLLPLASRAKVIRSSTKAFALIEGLDLAGQAVVMTLTAREQIQALQDQDVAGMAGIYEQYIELAKTHHESDPQLAKLKADIDKRAEALRKRTLEVVGELIKQQAIAYAPIKIAGHIDAARARGRMGTLHDTDSFVEREGVEPRYNEETGQIEGDAQRMDNATISRLTAEQDAHMGRVRDRLAGELGVPPSRIELKPGDLNALWQDGDLVQVRYKGGTSPDAAVALWKEQARKAGLQIPEARPPVDETPGRVDPTARDRTPAGDRTPGDRTPGDSTPGRPPRDDARRPRDEAPETDGPPPEHAARRTTEVPAAPEPELIGAGDLDARVTTAAAVPGSTFRGGHEGDGTPERVKKAAQRKLKSAAGEVEGVKRIEPTHEADTFLVTPKKGAPFTVRVISAEIDGTAVARTVVNPTKRGASKVDRTTDDGEVKTRKVKVEGRYVIQISDRVDPVHAERTVAHELAEVMAERKLAADGEAVSPDALVKGPVPDGAKLSPHDHGRIAELNVLARQGSHRRRNGAHDAELLALIEHLGLRDGVEGAQARRALIDEHLSPHTRRALDRLSKPDAELHPDAKAQLDTIRDRAADHEAEARAEAEYRAPLHETPDAAGPGEKVGRDRAVELAREAALARAARSDLTLAHYRALARTLPPGEYPKVVSPQIGGGAALAARVPGQLLVDNRGRWQVDASADLAQTASQLRGLKDAGVGDPFEFAGPNDRVPMAAVRYWEDSIAAQGPVIDGTARLGVLDDGRTILTIEPSDGSARIELEIEGTPVVASGFPPERIPGTPRGMSPDQAITDVETALRAIIADPTKAAIKDKAEAALARIEPLTGLAVEKGAREKDLSTALAAIRDNGLDAEIQAAKGKAHQMLEAGDAWKQLTDAHNVPGGDKKVFLGDEANLESLDPFVTDKWVIAGTGGTGISAAEIILAKNPAAHVTMGGQSIPAGLLENDQFQKVVREHGDADTVKSVVKSGGARGTPGDGRFTLLVGIEVGTARHDGGQFAISDTVPRGHTAADNPLKGGAYVAAIGRDAQLPPFVADLHAQFVAQGGRAEIMPMYDGNGQYLGYQTTFFGADDAVKQKIDVTGAASRFPPWDLLPAAIRTNPDALAEVKNTFWRASDVDAPPESGNFDGGFVASAEQAARYGRKRRAEER